MEGHIAIGAIVPFRFGGGFRVLAKVAARLSTANGVQQLGAGRRGSTNKVKFVIAPVRGHLASAAGSVSGSADSLQEHFCGSYADGQAQGAIAVIREEPVVSRTKRQSGSDLKRLMPRPRDLKEDLLLPLEKNLAVVEPAGQIHEPVNFDHLLRAEPEARAFAGAGTCAGNRKFHVCYSLSRFPH